MSSTIQMPHIALLQKLPEALLPWYQAHKRVLPWRENTDPYRVWVSEIMLQQTRVDTVIPYYLRFLEELPTIKDLADAEEEKLLKLWEGLGYYSRVRNMQRAARQICRDFGGVFPSDPKDVGSLVGIGPYTVGAICSIAFEAATPAVDGNVLRVISRIDENSSNIADTAYKKAVTEALRQVYPKPGQRGDFTQSLMELGATVCLPNGAPQCSCCPAKDFCQAYRHGSWQQYPVLAKKPERKIQHMTVFLLQCEDCIAVCKRPKTGLLAGMWQLPNTLQKASTSTVEKWLENNAIQEKPIGKPMTAKHIFTHIEWQMKCYTVHCKEKYSGFYWASRAELGSSVAMPSAFKKLLKEI